MFALLLTPFQTGGAIDWGCFVESIDGYGALNLTELSRPDVTSRTFVTTIWSVESKQYPANWGGQEIDDAFAIFQEVAAAFATDEHSTYTGA